MELRAIAREDIETVWRMQVEAFSELLEKYQDYHTNPGAENMDKIIAKFEQPWTTYYFIIASNEKVGVIRIVDKKRWNQKTNFPHLDYERA